MENQTVTLQLPANIARAVLLACDHYKRSALDAVSVAHRSQVLLAVSAQALPQMTTEPRVTMPGASQ